jgi:hypothetical protein
MTVARETLCLRKIMQMVSEGKTITIQPDFGSPYTLIICNEKEECKHTHNTYYFGEFDQQAVLLSVESLCNDILGGPGLSFVGNLKEGE